MIDKYGRKINYLRISVTDRCNFRCRYCMPEEGVRALKHEDILSFEEILQFVKAVAPLGIERVRVTGGEPLVRKGIVEFINALSKINGIKDISMTTNGSLFKEMSKELKKAGLKRVNFSLDTLKAEKFSYITRRGKLGDVLEGIKEALNLGFNPVKINTVVAKGFNDDEIDDFAKLTIEYPLVIRFIELMPLGEGGWAKGRFISAQEIKSKIKSDLIKVENIEGSGPAEYFKLKNAKGFIGFITPISRHFCEKCNRIRLTADGKLKPCLASSKELDVKEVLRNNADMEQIQKAFGEALSIKPYSHNMKYDESTDYEETKRRMWQIGG